MYKSKQEEKKELSVRHITIRERVEKQSAYTWRTLWDVSVQVFKNTQPAPSVSSPLHRRAVQCP